MITMRALTDADWEQAQPWRETAWATPRTAHTRVADERYMAFVSGDQLRAVGGFINQERLPPGTAQLLLYIAPDGTNQHQVCAYLRLALDAAFVEHGYDIIVLAMAKDDTVSSLFPIWQWAAAQVTKDLGGPTHDDQVIASGGWWLEGDGISKLDPATAPTLRLHWIARR